MMDDGLVRKIYDCCVRVLPEAREIAIKNWGKVQNEPKEVAGVENTDQNAYICAKSEIDLQIQDLFLSAFLDLGLENYVSIYTEEDTGLVKQFIPGKELILVMDPIDGSLDYIEKRTGYSINLALISKKQIEFSIVCFPSLNTQFTNLNSAEYSCQENKIPTEFIPKKNVASSKIIEFNRRTPPTKVEELKGKGYTLLGPSHGLYSPMLKVLNGDRDALIADTPNIRDVLLHEILAGLFPDELSLTNYQGKPLNWFSKGTLPEFLFARKSVLISLIN
ncbi:hypothetical protein KBD45_05610 [Candidatus Dojkabacteria bacterium]|nr:hypothetical protein [Candidatus Dojkabacteria bacterium]